MKHDLLSACDFVFKCMPLMLNFVFISSHYLHSRFTTHTKSFSNPGLSKCSHADLLYPSHLTIIPNSPVLFTATSRGVLSMEKNHSFTCSKMNTIIYCDLTGF